MNNKDYALMCKALGDETRVKIFDMLKNGEMCACKILDAFHFTQPTLSYHMKLLSDSHLVNVVKEGKWNHYSVNREAIKALSSFINSTFVDK